MVSDFFYPNAGGVESHLYHISQRLIQRGHKVVIITHVYGGRSGIRCLTNGLKVYHVPMQVVFQNATPPTLYGFFPVFRAIVLRERISIVHGHQAFSSMCHEAIIHARTMGLKTCFTDHSLFGFSDPSSIVMNKFLKFTLSDIDHVICVSHTSKENTVLRAALTPQNVSVIPNAVIASSFKPDPSMQDPNGTTIVVISRQTYRKGMDLLVAVIPRICRKYSRVRFVIGGDGPKRIDLEQMREKHLLHDRVEFLGSIKAHQVRNTLVRGQIFLNTSLTEAFCIGIVEAACAGLLVVSTKVGGVPEVLPRHMIIFSKPEEDDLVQALDRSIEMIQRKEVQPAKFNDELKEMYSWVNVAERTEKVYDAISQTRDPPLIERLRSYYGCGVFVGKLFCIMIALDYLFWVYLEWVLPRDEIEPAPKFPYKKFKKMCQRADKEDELEPNVDSL
ncbi:Phosphatidylinositol N-acetylglucosaminyltransferase gpi3 subunit [Haplosporangium gracile]|nr:Phosphatidylinositol N-acetylglucosaminyltransferase gpi3 subunit [Haplosporangium gracile]